MIETTLLNELDKLGIEVTLPDDLDSNLFELGLDSLSLVKLILSLEKQFSLSLVQKNFSKEPFSTFNKIREHILSKQEAA